MNAFAEFHFRVAVGNFHDAASHRVTLLVFGDVFIQAARHELLNTQAQLTLFGIDGQHLRPDRLADLHNFLRMVNALLRAHVADVNHSFDAFGELYERSELGDADDRTFDHGTGGKLLRRVQSTDLRALVLIPATCVVLRR